MIEEKLAILKNLTLLLVEDDVVLLDITKLTLAHFFKDILTAPEGASAYELYKSNIVDVIITDYSMPVMNGYELCAKIREENKKIPMVIMSNFTDKEQLLSAMTLNLRVPSKKQWVIQKQL